MLLPADDATDEPTLLPAPMLLPADEPTDEPTDAVGLPSIGEGCASVTDTPVRDGSADMLLGRATTIGWLSTSQTQRLADCEPGSHRSDREVGGGGATMFVRDGKTARRRARSSGVYSSTTASAARRKEM